MQEKEKKSYIFTKILLVALLIFIGLALYAYKMIKEEKENNYKNSTIVLNNTPMPHPPLTQRDKEENKSANTKIVSPSLENNKTRSIPEGAEYISPEEQLKREKETNLSIPLNEEVTDGEIIPQDELKNYEEAITIPITENTTRTTPNATNPFNNLSLGTPIGEKNNQSYQEHPTLGTAIGNTPINPF